MYEMKSIHTDVIQASNSVPVVVQFYADWCGPCRILKPVMEQLVGQSEGRWKLVYLNVEKEPGLALQYQVKALPTMIMFSNEEAIARMTGSKPSYIINNWLDNNLPKSEAPPVEFPEINRALRVGNLAEAKKSLIQTVLDRFKDIPLLKLLKSIELIGVNNNEARNNLNEIGRDSSMDDLVKLVRDLIDIEENEADVHTPSSSPFDEKTKDVLQKIDIRAIDFDLLSTLVLMGINEVRNKKGAGDLQTHSVLTAAAKDHNDYQIRYDQLTHHQQDPGKRTVKERIDSFGGGFRMMGENVQYKGFPTRISGNQRTIITNSYHQAAEDLVRNWVNSPGHYRNLINPSYQYVGTAVGWNPENAALFATQVFGS